MAWRKTLCEVAGYGDLKQRRGFGGETPWPDNGDALIKLLDHSDCDGEIAAKDCGPIADRLDYVFPEMQAKGYARETAQFIAGLRDAESNHENVIFH